MFTIKQVCEKYLADGKDVFWAFMDLEKSYDTKSAWSWRKIVESSVEFLYRYTERIACINFQELGEF